MLIEAIQMEYIEYSRHVCYCMLSLIMYYWTCSYRIAGYIQSHTDRIHRYNWIRYADYLHTPGCPTARHLVQCIYGVAVRADRQGTLPGQKTPDLSYSSRMAYRNPTRTAGTPVPPNVKELLPGILLTVEGPSGWHDLWGFLPSSGPPQRVHFPAFLQADKIGSRPAVRAFYDSAKAGAAAHLLDLPAGTRATAFLISPFGASRPFALSQLDEPGTAVSAALSDVPPYVRNQVSKTTRNREWIPSALDTYRNPTSPANLPSSGVSPMARNVSPLLRAAGYDAQILWPRYTPGGGVNSGSEMPYGPSGTLQENLTSLIDRSNPRTGKNRKAKADEAAWIASLNAEDEQAFYEADRAEESRYRASQPQGARKAGTSGKPLLIAANPGAKVACRTKNGKTVHWTASQIKTMGGMLAPGEADRCLRTVSNPKAPRNQHEGVNATARRLDRQARKAGDEAASEHYRHYGVSQVRGKPQRQVSGHADLDLFAALHEKNNPLHKGKGKFKQTEESKKATALWNEEIRYARHSAQPYTFPVEPTRKFAQVPTHTNPKVGRTRTAKRAGVSPSGCHINPGDIIVCTARGWEPA